MSEPARIYEDDFYTWTQQQAAALRKLTPAQVGNEVDLEHVVEEIADLGNSELATVTSLILQIFVHLMKIALRPDTTDREHWSDEIDGFRDQIDRRFSPGMRQHIDLDREWSRARKRVGKKFSDTINVVEQCPFALDEVLIEDFKLEDVPILNP